MMASVTGPMDNGMGGARSILKTGARRTVTREVVDGVPRIVKRFHSPGWLDRFQDRFRARRELIALQRLAERGLPVPRPVGVHRREGRWELVLEELTGAVPLEDLLEGRAPWPRPPMSVAASLGRLLAALVRTDVKHGDLHAGNVLIDPRGRAHLIDLAHVRMGKPVDARALLVGCTAGLRERDPEGFRARALVAFRRDARSAWGNLTPEVIEAGARERRRKQVLRRVARYWRESGALRQVEVAGVRGLLARELPDQDLPALDSQAPPRGYVAVQARSLDHLAERWERAARCQMHRLLAERPVALIHAPHPRAVMAAPILRPLDPDTLPRPAALGRALGALHDRGLALDARDRASLALAPDGEVWIAGGELVESQGLAGPAGARAWLTRLGMEPETEFVTAFLGVQRGTARELSDLGLAWGARG